MLNLNTMTVSEISSAVFTLCQRREELQENETHPNPNLITDLYEVNRKLSAYTDRLQEVDEITKKQINVLMYDIEMLGCEVIELTQQINYGDFSRANKEILVKRNEKASERRSLQNELQQLRDKRNECKITLSIAL